jgi:hypothetical protein
MSRGAVTRDYVLAAVRVLSKSLSAWAEERHGWERDESFLVRVRGMHLGVREIFGARGRLPKGYVSLLKILLGDLGRADVDLYRLVGPGRWPELLAEGVAVRWERYGDGAEYAPMLVPSKSRWELKRGQDPRRVNHDLEVSLEALRASGVDLSRHHYCNKDHACLYDSASPFEAEFGRAGATSCGQGQS